MFNTGITLTAFVNEALCLLTILPILINIGILIWVSATLPSNRTNTAFLIFIYALVLWQTLEQLIRLSQTEESARTWARLSETSILFVTPFAMLFGLRFSKYNERIKPVFAFAALFLVPTFFLLGIVGNLDAYRIVPSDTWGWIVNPEPNSFMIALYSWLALLGLVSVIFFWYIYFRRRRQSGAGLPELLLAIGFSAPTFGGIAAEVVRPLMFKANNIPLTAPFLTIFSACALLAITKYKLLDYSPRHQWKKLVKLMKEGILIVNTEDRIMYVNDCFCEMVGYSSRELEGKVASEMLLGKTQWEVVKSALEVAGNITRGKTEIQIRTKSGEKLWILFSGSAYLDARGNIIGSLGVHTNISNLKAAQQCLKDKVEELNIFFYKASHDLKSPAATIKGLVSISKLDTTTSSEYIISAIEKCSDKLLDTTNSLSQIAVISQRNCEIEEINWEESIARLTRELNPETDTCSTCIVLKMEDRFFADRYLVDLILKNAIANAFRYQDTNKRKCQVEISIVPEKEGVRITVSDNGCGMPGELVRNPFGMFARGDARSGIGLGLYTIKSAVDRLGGQVSLKSVPKEGTCISILIPPACQVATR